MRIYKPVYKVPKSWQRVPVEKVTKAMGVIVGNVKISKFSPSKKSEFSKKFTNNVQKMSDVIGDGKISQKDLSKIFRESLKKKTLPKKWIADRYTDLLTKGGTSLSTKWETAPDTQGLKDNVSSVSGKKAVDPIKFRRDLADRIKQINSKANNTDGAKVDIKAEEKEDDGNKVAVSRFEATRDAGKKAAAEKESSKDNNIFSKKMPESDKNVKGFQPLKSGGKFRVTSAAPIIALNKHDAFKKGQVPEDVAVDKTVYGIRHKSLISQIKNSQDVSDSDIPPEKAFWEDAYKESSETINTEDQSEPKNNDIDD